MDLFDFWGKFKSEHKKIYRLIKWLTPLLIFFFGFIIGLFLSPKIFFFQYTGLFGLSNFQHTDFKNYFQDNFKANQEYSYSGSGDLIASIKNSFVQEEQAKTVLEVPEFIKTNCVVKNPINSEDTCERYSIPAGSIKQLAFNITVGDDPKNKHSFCLFTKRLTKWLWFSNQRRTCIEITINK